MQNNIEKKKKKQLRTKLTKVEFQTRIWLSITLQLRILLGNLKKAIFTNHKSILFPATSFASLSTVPKSIMLTKSKNKIE